MNWNVPFQILAVGVTPTSDTPDDRALQRKLLFLDLPTDLLGWDSNRCIPVEQCRPCRNPGNTHDISKYLLWGLTTHAPTASATKSPPYHVTPGAP